MLKFSNSFTLIQVDPCVSMLCPVEYELCEGGVCKCGTSDSCENKTTGAFCDLDNSVCKCAYDVPACAGDDICTNGACPGMLLITKYILSIVLLRMTTCMF